MFKWFAALFKRHTVEPDLHAFDIALRKSVNVERHDGQQVAKDFRRLFLRDEALGKRVLFMLMTWCGDYESEIPEDNNGLNRWAGKQEIAWQIKAALHANLDEQPPDTKDITNAEHD